MVDRDAGYRGGQASKGTEGSRFRHWSRRMGAALARDEVRVPLQTTGAVLLAFGATFFMGSENLTWGVFSALFVVQASIGGTVSTALYRMGGAALGAALGVAAVMIPGEGVPGMLLSLVAGVGAMSLISTRWPDMAYGLVTVTIIIVAPDLYLIEGAMEKVLTIAIGSACGMVAALAVFPVSARRRAHRHLAEALRACGDLLDDCMQRLIHGKEGKDREIEARISEHLYKARTMASQARAERAPLAPARVAAQDIVEEAETFRSTLTLIDRFSVQPLPEEVHDATRERLMEFSNQAREQLEELAKAIAARTGCEALDLHTSFDRFCECAEESAAQNDMPQYDRERVFAIKQACETLLDNLEHLCARINEQYG